METMKIKRGDTFALDVRLKDASGQPLVLDVAHIKSQVRDNKDSLICDLTISTTGEAGLYKFTANTSSWSVGCTYVMDIQMNTSGAIRSSDTLSIYVEKDVTR